MSDSGQQHDAVLAVRETLYELARTADTENLSMLSYLLRLAIVESDRIIGDRDVPDALRADLGKR